MGRGGRHLRRAWRVPHHLPALWRGRRRRAGPARRGRQRGDRARRGLRRSGRPTAARAPGTAARHRRRHRRRGDRRAHQDGGGAGGRAPGRPPRRSADLPARGRRDYHLHAPAKWLPGRQPGRVPAGVRRSRPDRGQRTRPGHLPRAAGRQPGQDGRRGDRRGRGDLGNRAPGQVQRGPERGRWPGPRAARAAGYLAGGFTRRSRTRSRRAPAGRPPDRRSARAAGQ